MSKFGRKTINPGTGRLVQIQNKGSKESLLPARTALAHGQRTDYSKQTPSGANAPPSYQDLIEMAEMGASIKPR